MSGLEYVARRIGFRVIMTVAYVVLAFAHAAFVVGRAISWVGRRMMTVAARMARLLDEHNDANP
jgi:hypothetical protein